MGQVSIAISVNYQSLQNNYKIVYVHFDWPRGVFATTITETRPWKNVDHENSNK